MSTRFLDKIQQETIKYHQIWHAAIVSNRKTSMLFPTDLICLIKIKVLPSGQLSLVKLVKSSGNSLYDSFAEQAIYKAEPFDMPEDLTVNNALVNDEYIFTLVND